MTVGCILRGHRFADQAAVTVAAARLAWTGVLDWGFITAAAARSIYGFDTVQQCQRCGVVARHAMIAEESSG